MTLPRLSIAALSVLACSFLFPSSSSVSANHDDEGGDRMSFFALLESFNEVPAISSTGRGSFRARLSADGLTLHYKESFSGLSAPVTQSHIHFGQRHTAGAVMVFLCQTSGNPDPELLPSMRRFDLGPDAERGIGRYPATPGEPYPSFVSAIDADGNYVQIIELTEAYWSARRLRHKQAGMSVLEVASVATRLPAQDLDRARRFYADKLGLQPVESRPGGLRYECGAGGFALAASRPPG